MDCISKVKDLILLMKPLTEKEDIKKLNKVTLLKKYNKKNNSI